MDLHKLGLGKLNVEFKLENTFKKVNLIEKLVPYLPIMKVWRHKTHISPGNLNIPY